MKDYSVTQKIGWKWEFA